MNPVRQLWCRAVQTVLRLSIPLLPYRRPETLPSVEAVPGVLKRHGCARVLLVTGPNVTRRGLPRPLLDALREAGIHCAVYDKTPPNPTVSAVEEGAALYRAQGCQAILGFGGGSNLDCAKAVGVRVALPHKPLSQCAGVLKVRRSLPLLIAVPTTAGSGSETTIAAVVTDRSARHKYAISDFPLIPQYAVLDPAVTVSLPPFLTAATGMDALTHAVEAYIGRSTTKDTREAALTATRLIFANLDRAFADGSDLEARRNLLEASFLAGCAFTKSYVGYVHAIAHALGGAYDVPHGQANAVILPLVLERYGPAAHRKLAELARAAGVAEETAPVPQAAAAFLQAIRAMNARFGIGTTIPELRRADIPALARHADKEANPLYPVPLLLDADELAQLFERLLDKA